MIQNSATEIMTRSQYLRQVATRFGSDKASLRKVFLPIFTVLFVLVMVAFAWLILVPLIQTSGNSDMQWKGVNEQLISERMVARNGKNWNAGFTLSADAEKVLLAIDIKLIQQEGIRTPVLDKRKKTWLQGIDDVWNNKFFLQLPDQRLIPVVLAVNFKSVNVHHEVVVRKGSSDPNQHNWYVNTSANVISHEIGHMLGAYDEYRNGATSPEPVTIKGVSLMAKLAGDGVPRIRHLHLLQDKLVEITGLQSLVIVQPELGQ